MEKKLIASLIRNITAVLNIGTETGFDGFFYSESVEHSVTKDKIIELISMKPNWTEHQAYEYFLLPVISKNPEKHLTARSIYKILGDTSNDATLKRNYYEKATIHYILSRKGGFKNADDRTKFYAEVLTRPTSCKQCINYGGKIHELETFLQEYPKSIRNCEHENSCHSSVSVITQNIYNALQKRGRA